ncbi:NAD-dependent epimerase/dehydratase family protein [Nocardia takedensis]|uniref:NAD-dependent epimerase/dehydratase family protein n=1 Tax=Nocardia takedensis TaxID=259390 RepID=UPI0002D31B76|nr:NAD(P)-dependent oxidoreductase [Nocardia takedensis]
MAADQDGVASTVAVLGGTGSVGRHVCAAFAEAGHRVVVLSRTPDARVARHRFVPLDLAAVDPEHLAATLTALDARIVVNAAGSWSNSADELTSAHIRLAENLVAALSAMRPTPRLVHLGTVHEYGIKPAGAALAEDTEHTPETDFARTKYESSRRILAAAEAGTVDAIVLRVANVYGPDPAAASFLGYLAATLPGVDPDVGIELTIAEARRDYVDNRDVADAVLLAARHRGEHRVFNIGSGTATPLRELVYGLVAAAGLPASAVREKSAAVTSKGGDWTRVDATRAHTELGWRPRRTPADSMRALIRETSTAAP